MDIEASRVRQILELAILAPSGDNSQPWELSVRGNFVDLYNVPERDQSFLNFRQKAARVAHGALIENAVIAASKFGCEIGVQLVSDDKNANLVATLEIKELGIKEDPLSPWISKRTTNRKSFRSAPLTEKEKSTLMFLPDSIKDGHVRLVESRQEREAVAEAVVAGDRFILEHQQIHDFLFHQLRWGDEEARSSRNGLHIKTLELSFPQALFFRLLGHWGFLQTMNRFGLSNVFAKQAKHTYLSAPAFGVVAVQGDSDVDFVKAGRILERVWLSATSLGLSFQPFASTTFLSERLRSGETAGFSMGQIKQVKEAYQRLSETFHLEKEIAVMLFRVGHSAPPSTRSLRFPLENVLRRGNFEGGLFR